MKKGIIVLLITVLAAGMAFADFSGSASINFGVSLDKEDWGFTNETLDQYSFEFSVDTQSSAKGEDHQTNVWAEIAANISVSIEADIYNGVEPGIVYSELQLTTANIHIGDDFTIGILGAKTAYDYAKSWTNSGSPNYIPNWDLANNGRTGEDFNYTAGGFNVGYKGYTASFALNSALDAADLLNRTVFANLETKSYELAEGMTLQGALNYLFNKKNGRDNASVLGGAVKYGYASDKFTANVASDVQYNFLTKLVGLDVLATAAYNDYVDGAVYFGAYPGHAYVLEAKVGAEIPVTERVTLNLGAEVDNLLFGADIVDVDPTYVLTIGKTFDAFTLTVTGTYNAETIDPEEEVSGHSVALDLAYKADTLTAKAGISFGLASDGEKYYNCQPYASISTTALVENCTLSLGWSGANFVAKDFESDTYRKGSINAAAKISF